MANLTYVGDAVPTGANAGRKQARRRAVLNGHSRHGAADEPAVALSRDALALPQAL